MFIFKAIFAVGSLIGNYFKIKKAVKLIRTTSARIKKKCEKRRIKKAKLLAKGYPKLKKLTRLKKLKRVSYI